MASLHSFKTLKNLSNIFNAYRMKHCILLIKSRFKYILVHGYSKIMHHTQNMSKKSPVEYLGYLPDFVLIGALGFGLYTQWKFTEEIAVSVIAILGAFVFSVSIALQYYFGLENVGQALFHIWVGCLVGILTFMDHKELQFVTTERVMEALFMTSLALGCFWNVLRIILKLHPPEARLLTASEGLECLGVIIASLITGVDCIALSLFTLAFLFHIIVIRLKSTTGFISFLSFMVVGILWFFPALQIKPNIYSLIYFVGKHAFLPILYFKTSSLSTLERWRACFTKPKIVRYLFILIFSALEISLAIVVGQRSSQHKEWYIVLPLYIAVAVVWLVFHLMFFLTCWKLQSKISECNSDVDERRSFNHIMAAKGKSIAEKI